MTLFAVGSVLWILVAVAGLYALSKSNANDSQSAANRAHLGPLVLSPQKNAGTTQREPVSVVPQPKSNEPENPWDPQGIADFELIERSGRTITKQHLLGKPWAVCFIFTRCAGTCPAITNAMARLQAEVEDLDVRLVSISVDPEYDTPQRLRDYAKGYGADPERWLFLTGDKLTIYRLIQNSFKLPVKEMLGEDRQPGFEVLHSNSVMLVDAPGHVVAKYNGTSPVEMAQLRKALQARAAGPADSSSGQSPADGSEGGGNGSASPIVSTERSDGAGSPPAPPEEGR